MAKPKEDFSLKETKPNIRATKTSGPATAFDFVEQMNFLFVKILKAKGLMGWAGPDTCDPYVEVKLGNYKATTLLLEKRSRPEWNQVFVFRKEKIQTTELEIAVKDKTDITGDVIGKVKFAVSGIPTRVPPDSPLAPQWYVLEDRKGKKGRVGELMLSVWMGTQADEAYSEAWYAEAATASGDGIAYTHSKQYMLPTLWYLRVNLIQAQDLVLRDWNGNDPELFVQATLGNEVFRSKVSKNKNANPTWNEDMMFVAAEPFDQPLVLSVENKLQPNREESVSLGKIVIPLTSVGKRDTAAAASNKWYDLERPEIRGPEGKEVKFASKLNVRVSLDGGYHVFNESTKYPSDLRATSKPLWGPVIGTLTLGIMNATGLSVMKPRENRTDAYCVAKYGKKWLRTKTIPDSLAPQWNEQSSWEVYDPCTVLTIGVFDNTHVLGGDVLRGGFHQAIGKVIRIRLSTLETNRIYTLSYPILALQPSGVKKMGQIQLNVMFTSFSTANTLLRYRQPLLPKMHYLSPLSVPQIINLRRQAAFILSLRLSRAVPPLRKEVVDYMTDVETNMWSMWRTNMIDVEPNTWSMRRTNANIERVTELLKGFVDAYKWIKKALSWENTPVTAMSHLIFLFVVLSDSWLLLAAVAIYVIWFMACHVMKRRKQYSPYLDYLDCKLPTLYMAILLPYNYPQSVLSFLFLYAFYVGASRYRKRPRNPPLLDCKLSHADTASVEDLDEEFDTFQTSNNTSEVLRRRYDRLRFFACTIQVFLGDFATQGERIQSLLSWRDPRATFIVLCFLLVAALLAFYIPFWITPYIIWLNIACSPTFRNALPSMALNFLKRMPTKTDSIF